MKYALLAVPALLAFSSAAAAECLASLEPGPTSVNFDGIDIGAGLSSQESLVVSVRNDGDSACSLVLRVGRGLGADPAAPPFVIYGPTGEIEILPVSETTGTTRSDIAVDVAALSTRTVPLSFRLETGWGLEKGLYSDQLRLALLDAGARELAGRNIAVTIDVPASVKLGFYGASGGIGPTRIDLGELSPNEVTVSDPFDIRVWSTSPYDVAFSSENGGHLVHTNGVDRIPYHLTMSAAEVDLVSGVPFHFAAHTDAVGDIHPLLLRVDPVRGLAGDYSDRVTITVTAM